MIDWKLFSSVFCSRSDPLSVLSTIRIEVDQIGILIKNRDCFAIDAIEIPSRSAEKCLETWKKENQKENEKCFRLIENYFSSCTLNSSLKWMSNINNNNDLVHLSQFIFCFFLSSQSTFCFDCNLFSVWSSLSSW